MILFSFAHSIVRNMPAEFSHVILVLHCRPPWSRCWKANDKLIHVVLRYSIGIHPVPVPAENIDDVSCISLRASAAELGV